MSAERPDLDELADLDAGLLDEDRAEQVRTAAMADPRSAAVLDALAATRAELGALPDPPVPAAVAARWTTALAEAQRGATPSELRERPPEPGERPSEPRPLAAARRPGRRAWLPRPAVLAAALLVAVLAAAGVLQAAPEQPPMVSRSELVAFGRASIGVGDTGALADAERRIGCLRRVAAPGVAPDAPLLGGSRVLLDGRAGVLLVLATGELGAFHVVVVDPDCGPAGGTLLSAVRVGR